MASPVDKKGVLNITRQYSRNSVSIRGDKVTILEYSGSKIVGKVEMPLADFQKVCVTFFSMEA